METIELSSVPGRKKRVVAQAVEDEIVLILPDLGKVKVLNDTGSRIWEWIDGQSTVEEIALKLHRFFEVEMEQAREDVLVFLRELRQKDLIDVIGSDKIAPYAV